MAFAGGGLVTPPPVRPVQLALDGLGTAEQSGEEPADLVAGQRDQLVSVWVLMVSLGGGQHDQECVGEQGQDGPYGC